MTIDASQDFLDHSQSLTSPIVINDKMLSQSADSPSPIFNTARMGQKIPKSEQKILDVPESFNDSDALIEILMDLNTT